ncbi:MAG: hypothetical protein QMB62_11280 [Oscillospiraceae bacterium]
MEITVTATGRRFSADIEDAAADRTFTRIVGILTGAKSTKPTKQAESPTPKKAQRTTSITNGGKAHSIEPAVSVKNMDVVRDPVLVAGGKDPAPEARRQAYTDRKATEQKRTEETCIRYTPDWALPLWLDSSWTHKEYISRGYEKILIPCVNT